MPGGTATYNTVPPGYTAQVGVIHSVRVSESKVPNKYSLVILVRPADTRMFMGFFDVDQDSGFKESDAFLFYLYPAFGLFAGFSCYLNTVFNVQMFKCSTITPRALLSSTRRGTLLESSKSALCFVSFNVNILCSGVEPRLSLRNLFFESFFLSVLQN